MYNNYEEAVHFVFIAFKGMRRIKENIDLAFHSISVGLLLAEINMSEEMIISGLLHDIIEDTKYTYDDIKNKFGQKIADNVLYLSENKDIKDFKSRKLEFINRLDSQLNNDLIIVEIADKLQNLLSDYELFKKNGKEALTTLNTNYEMNKWYYLQMLNLFNKRIDSSNELLIRYKNIVKEYFENEIDI